MDTNSTTPPINSHKFFASLVQSTHSLQYFLEFCSIHSHNKQGDTFNQWHNYVTFWLEVEHHRQLVGEDQSSLERQGIKIYKEFLTNNLNLSLQSKIPQLKMYYAIQNYVRHLYHCTSSHSAIHYTPHRAFFLNF